MTIYLAYRAQIALFNIEKVFITILMKYLDFANGFFSCNTIKTYQD